MSRIFMGYSFRVLVFSGLLFFGLCFSGFLLASKKPLWLDEYHSLKGTITALPYAAILKGHNELEGNNAPLFYLTQKLLCDAIGYDPRVLVPVGPNFYTDPFSNAYLRLIPIFFLALTPCALFYYFSRRYSFLWGGFAALLCLSSWLFWWYGLEARPYIHSFALTALQMMVFLEIIRRGEGGRLWPLLAGINVLLALTVTASILQTLLLGAGLVFFVRKDLTVPRAAAVFGLPVLAAGYYYAAAINGVSFFRVPVYRYYLANIPWDILIIAALFFVCLAVARALRGDKMNEALPTVFVFLSVSAVALIGMLFLKLYELPMERGGSPFAYRHLIHLVPVGIIAATVFSHAIFRCLQDIRMRIGFISFLAGLLAWRFFYAYNYVHHWIGV